MRNVNIWSDVSLWFCSLLVPVWIYLYSYTLEDNFVEEYYSKVTPSVCEFQPANLFNIFDTLSSTVIVMLHESCSTPLYLLNFIDVPFLYGFQTVETCLRTECTSLQLSTFHPEDSQSCQTFTLCCDVLTPLANWCQLSTCLTLREFHASSPRQCSAAQPPIISHALLSPLSSNLCILAI